MLSRTESGPAPVTKDVCNGSVQTVEELLHRLSLQGPTDTEEDRAVEEGRRTRTEGCGTEDCPRGVSGDLRGEEDHVPGLRRGVHGLGGDQYIRGHDKSVWQYDTSPFGAVLR